MAFADPGKGRSVIDPGSSKLYPPTVVLAEACVEGDVLGYSSGWKKAFGGAAGVIQGRFVAMKGGAIGDTIPVSMDCVVRGYTGGTAGDVVYADYTTSGKVTDTVSTTPTESNVKIGILLNATDVMFFLNRRADSVVAGG
jgi:hypothetical protein